jgi:hypothetical protein
MLRLTTRAHRMHPDGARMTTKLTEPLRREIEIDGAPYTLTITPEGFTLVVKGRRKGYELAWSALVSGDAALATALNASLRVKPASSDTRQRQEPGGTKNRKH